MIFGLHSLAVARVLAAGVLLVSAFTPLRIAEAQASAASPVQVVTAYRRYLEALKPDETAALFAPDAEIFEGGSAEGSPAQYLAHHLKPEFTQFESFLFSDVTQKVGESGDVAWISEKYNYRIVLKNEGRRIESQGVATYVLRRTEGMWRIQMLHMSSRKRADGQKSPH